jgi:hypothetical protein
MTKRLVQTELRDSGGTGPLAGWLLPGAPVLEGVLAAALIGTAYGTRRSGSRGETPEPPSVPRSC